MPYVRAGATRDFAAQMNTDAAIEDGVGGGKDRTVTRCRRPESSPRPASLQAGRSGRNGLRCRGRGAARLPSLGYMSPFPQVDRHPIDSQQ